MHRQALNLRGALFINIICALSCAFLPLPALCQITNGAIYGTVTDSSRMAVTGAAVTAINENTSTSKTTQTDDLGNYIFSVLDPGSYEVHVQRTGFNSQTQQNLRLDANQNVHVNFTLKIGSVEQTMTVESATALVDTRESQIAYSVDQRSIQDLPLNGRNAYDLVQIVPGVTNYLPDIATGSRAGTQVTANGIVHNSAFYLDGAYNTDVQLGGNVLPNSDALQEFRILTSNYDAEFGHLAGGVINVITRSGTNQYHGLAYDYLRNNIFNARNWFLTSVTPLRQNQFGGNIGGPAPMTRQHGFFFFSYQGLRIRQPLNIASSSLLTPTELERAGDFRGSPLASRPNVSCHGVQYIICPDLLDPVAQNLLKFVPVGVSTIGTNYGHPAQQSANNNLDADQALVRIDYRLGQDHQLSGLYFQSRGSSNNPTIGNNQIVDYAGMQNYEGQYNGVATDVWTMSPSRVNSLRAYYQINHYIVANTFGNQHMLADLGSEAAPGGSYGSQPYFSVTGYWQMGTNNSGPNNQSSSTLGISDTFNLTAGRHSIKFGGSYLWGRYSATGGGSANGSFTFNGSATGNALADFLEGKANSLTQNNGSFLRNHSLTPSLFAQDDWHISSNLTLNLGIHWEYYPPYTGQNNTGTFVPGTQSTRFPTAPLGLLTAGDKGIPDGVLHTPWNSFAPRLGFAYDLYGNGSASLRGAYGIFYTGVQQIGFITSLVQQPFLRSVTIFRTPNLVTPYAPGPDPFPYISDPAHAAFLSGATIFSLPPVAKTIPSVQAFSLEIQQQYGAKWSSQISYVGNVSRHFYITLDENSPIYDRNCTVATCGTTTGQNLRRPYQPTPETYIFGAISLAAPVANTSYHSLQSTVARKFDRYFSLEISYVWSKVLGYGPPTNAFDLNSSRGVLDINVPNNFVASYLLGVPQVHRFASLVNRLLSGWQLNGITTLRSGQPFNVTSGSDTNFDGNLNDRPDVVGSPHLPGGRSRYQIENAFFNKAAFASLSPGTPYGNAPFNMLSGPKYLDTDLSAFRSFHLYRESLAQFRFEVFNTFNNVNLNAPNSNLSSPAFGTIPGSSSPRVIQLGLRLSF